jgi:hypothetical protein
MHRPCPEGVKSVVTGGPDKSAFTPITSKLRIAMGLPEIEDKLRSEAGNARSPEDRRHQIPSIINSLRKPSERAVGFARSG